MIEVLREQAGGCVPVFDCQVHGMKTFGLMSDALGKIIEVDTNHHRAYLNLGIVGTPPESDEELLKIFGLTSKFPEGEYEGYLHVLVTPPSKGSRSTIATRGRWGAIYLLYTDLSEAEIEAKKDRRTSMEFKVTNRLEGNQRVQLLIDDLVWNEITGPTAVAIIQEIDSKTRFDEREMAIIKAMFAGEISAARLFEGGDYTYDISDAQGMTWDEMDLFLEKIG